MLRTVERLNHNRSQLKYKKKNTIECEKSRNKIINSIVNLMSSILINFNNESDTMYTHTPQQYPIEFMFYWRCDLFLNRFFYHFNACLWKADF